MENMLLETWPGGFKTASGGTRTAIKLDRPWQVEMPDKPENCPFCKEYKENDRGLEVERFEFAGGWRLRRNQLTPFPFHNLIIPFECWEKECVRILGGWEKIFAALHVAAQVAQKEERRLWLTSHVGYGAGQNYPHTHYHLLQPHTEGILTSGDFTDSKRKQNMLVMENNLFSVVAGGCRAGMCFIIPKCGLSIKLAKKGTASSLTSIFHEIIRLYNEKFRSVQGLPPDYMIGLKFFGGRFVYGYYLPILNNWGSTEYFAILEGTPFILPWPHEKTVEFLKS